LGGSSLFLRNVVKPNRFLSSEKPITNPFNSMKNLTLLIFLTIVSINYLRPLSAIGDERSLGFGLVDSLVGHTSSVNTINISRDGRYIVSGGADSTIRIWDGITHKEIRKISDVNTVILTIAIVRNGTQIVSGGMEALGRVWDLNSGRLMRDIGGHKIEIRAIAYSDKKTC